jgi:hypothetical protein
VDLATSGESGINPNDPGTSLPGANGDYSTNAVWGHAVDDATWIIDWAATTNGFRFRE